MKPNPYIHAHADNNSTNNTNAIVLNYTALVLNITASKTLVCIGEPVTLFALGAHYYNWTGD